MRFLSLSLLLSTLTACGSGRTASTRPGLSKILDNEDHRLASARRFSWSEEAFVVARGLVKDCLSHTRIRAFEAEQGRRPAIKVVPSIFQTTGSVDPLLLEKIVEMELINSRKVRVVSAADLASQPPTLKVPTRSLRPDFMLTVSVTGIGSEGSSTVVLTTLELVDVKSNEKIWAKVHRQQTSPSS
jgi:hypothetical protein